MQVSIHGGPLLVQAIQAITMQVSRRSLPTAGYAVLSSFFRVKRSNFFAPTLSQASEHMNVKHESLHEWYRVREFEHAEDRALF